MPLKCIYEYKEMKDGRKFYICSIMNQNIPNREMNISGSHNGLRCNKDVEAVVICGCAIRHIPKGLTKCFPLMESLTISGLQACNITKDDLREYKKLKRLYILKSQIEYLPDDLFKKFRYLEEVSFEGGNMRIVEPNILDGLKSLRYVSFRDGFHYTKLFSLYPDYKPNATLNEVKDELYQVFNRYNDLMQKIEKPKSKYSVRTQTDNTDKPKDPEPKTGIFYSLINHINDDRFKDFKIHIGDREFHVHKFVLAARSPTFAEFLLINPEVKSMDLFDIPVDIFEVILTYMYTDEFPKIKRLNSFYLFSVADRFKIEELKDFAAMKLIDMINGQNALEAIKFGHKYEHAGLKKKAYDQLKVEYPRINFQDDWADEPDYVEMVIEKFKKMDKTMKMLEDEFENELMESE